MNRKTVNRLKAAIICLAVFCAANLSYARTVRVLFVGNSYITTNNLPQILANMAASTGDTLVYDVSAPGGASFESHYSATPATIAKMQTPGWDYVVLQEQSQRPARTVDFFYWLVYPFAKRLDSVIHHYNPCAETIFYMTWGRKNGDPSLCPNPFNYRVFCEYHTMDSVTRERYKLLGDTFKSTISPVGAVWRYMRFQHPQIDMYDADESHPSPAGSYAGACAFYTAIFKRSPDSIKYDFSLSAADAAIIRSAARRVVYDSMYVWNIGMHETFADFFWQFTGPNTVNFVNRSTQGIQWQWDFGDGQTSNATFPTHTYAAPGTYVVRLIITDPWQCTDTVFQKITILPTGIGSDPDREVIEISPNPANNVLYLTSHLFTNVVCTLKILSHTGQLVLQQGLDQRERQPVDISGLAKGTYVANIITTDDRSYKRKIVVL